MKITAILNNSGKKAYDLDLSEQYSIDSQLASQEIHIEDKSDLSMQCKIHAMPGFCILDEALSSYKASSLDFSVSGGHILIVLFYMGNCKITDQLQGGSEHCFAGIISRKQQNATRLRIAVSPGERHSRLVLVLSPDYVGELLKNESWMLKDTFLSNLFLEKPSMSNEESYFIDPTIRNVLNDLLRVDFRGAYKRPFFELKVKELLFMLHIQQELSGLNETLPTEMYRKLVTAKAFLISHFVEPPTIRQLSRIVLLNEFKLKQHFKESFGITIHAFIIRLKMEEARRLLLEDCSVGDIAAKTGYRSVSHFIETFKKHYGVTPKQAMTGYQFSSKAGY